MFRKGCHASFFVGGIVRARRLAQTYGVEPDVAKKLYEKVTPSLVAVQYTYDGEFGRREFVGSGLVVSAEGLIMTPLALFPLQFPDDQMKDFKIIVPGQEENEIEATFVGRDERSDVAFLKAKEAGKWTPVKFEESPVGVGDAIRSVGLLPKEAGYKSYFAEAFVSAVLRGPVPHVMVSSGGLAAVGSPVFNAEGKAIGLVENQAGQTLLLTDREQALHAITSPPRFFTPARDFLASLKNPPVAGKPLEVPWLGALLTGLKRDVAEVYGLKGQSVALVGEVIPNSPAAKAGLKTGDKIVKMDGEALERGDEPDETWMILMRKIRRQAVGSTVTFTVLRQKDAPSVDVPVALELQPRQAHQVKRYLADDLGFSVREVVFTDTYTKKLPADTQGVVVAYIRPGASAASAKLAAGDLITKLNGTAVKDLEQFKKLYQDSRKENGKESVVFGVTRESGTDVIRIEPPQ